MARNKRRVLKVTHQGGSTRPEAESDVYDCLVSGSISPITCDVFDVAGGAVVRGVRVRGCSDQTS